MEQPLWHLQWGDGPLVAAAIHHGHFVRPEVEQLLALSQLERLREEDPFTGDWTAIASNRMIALRSRFEFDLNRPREKGVYLSGEDAWGLRIWKAPPPAPILEHSLSLYDKFYEEVSGGLEQLVGRFGHVVVLDLHSYNHRRSGPEGPPADPDANPEINVGTATMDRNRWARIVEGFLHDLRRFDFLGRRLDVRENVKFFGGHFPRWLHQTFPHSVCALAIEVKKFFMDEWTGQADPIPTDAIERALHWTVPGILEQLRYFKDH